MPMTNDEQDRFDADLAILSAVIRNRDLLPGQRAALQRIYARFASPAETRTAVVKALKWRVWPGEVSFSAQASTGEYIVEKGLAERWGVWSPGETDTAVWYVSADAAKAAAQADYSARILSALTEGGEK